jgi:hypothetical protein
MLQYINSLPHSYGNVAILKPCREVSHTPRTLDEHLLPPSRSGVTLASNRGEIGYGRHLESRYLIWTRPGGNVRPRNQTGPPLPASTLLNAHTID